jgi:uncharacterized membrane protein
MPVGLVLLLVVVFVAVGSGVWYLMQRKRAPDAEEDLYEAIANTPTYTVATLSIAFDATVRARLQAALDALAGKAALPTAGALAQATGQVLAAALDGALLARATTREIEGQEATQQAFGALVEAERGRYLVEVLRGDEAGVRRVEAPTSQGRAEEGGGFVVVTALVACRGGLPSRPALRSRDALATDLALVLADRGDRLQAFELVWVPADPGDVMSSAEMAVKFPELVPLAPDARVGRRVCGYCHAVHAAELGTCPACGAPATPAA